MNTLVDLQKTRAPRLQTVYLSRFSCRYMLSRFNGWSDRIINLNVDYIEQELTLWSIGVTAIVRVVLKDGTFHENIGFAEAKNVSKGAALQEAKTVRRLFSLLLRMLLRMRVSDVSVFSESVFPPLVPPRSSRTGIAVSPL